MRSVFEYRIVKKVYPEQKEKDSRFYELREVYFTKSKKGKTGEISDLTGEPSEIAGYGKKSIKKQLKQMKKALKKPILVLHVPRLKKEGKWKKPKK